MELQRVGIHTWEIWFTNHLLSCCRYVSELLFCTIFIRFWHHCYGSPGEHCYKASVFWKFSWINWVAWCFHCDFNYWLYLRLFSFLFPPGPVFIQLYSSRNVLAYICSLYLFSLSCTFGFCLSSSLSLSLSLSILLRFTILLILSNNQFLLHWLSLSCGCFLFH